MESGWPSASSGPGNDHDPRPDTAPLAWRYFEGTLHGIAANLALDEALLIEADEGGMGPALRIWEPAEPAVVLGASRRLNEEVKLDACRRDGVAIARRSTGGGTVLIGPGTLNVAVILPENAAPGLKAVDVAQAHVLDRIAEAIHSPERAIERLGSGDLTLNRRKFSGSAQRRVRNHFLVHATILYEFPLESVERYLHIPDRQPAYRENRTHGDFLVNLPLPRAALVEAIRSAWLPPDRPSRSGQVPEDLVAKLVRAKFGDPAWVERL